MSGSTDFSDLRVVVPAFDEEPVLPAVLEELVAAGLPTVVVDDGSRDGTYRAALRYPVTVLRHPVNLGQGAALKTGIDYARSRPGVRYVVTFDADGQHVAADVARLLAPLRAGTHDVVLGSRFLDASPVGLPASRRAMLRLAVAFTRLTTGLPLTDTHNGMRAFIAEAAGRIRLVQDGMAHASEILSEIARLKLRVCEVPVTIRYTEYSTAKGQSIWNSVNILWEILRARLR